VAQQSPRAPGERAHGLAWYELDVNWIGISLLKALGLAWDIKVARIKQPVPYEDNDRSGCGRGRGSRRVARIQIQNWQSRSQGEMRAWRRALPGPSSVRPALTFNF
jgi:hypothetical protein